MIQDFIRTVPNYPIKGVNFYDLNSLFAGPMFKTVIGLLLDKATAMKTPTHIIGVESRGFVVGSVLASQIGVPFIMVRKKGAKYPGSLLQETAVLTEAIQNNRNGRILLAARTNERMNSVAKYNQT